MMKMQKKEFREGLGRRIKALRDKYELSQEDLAKLLGLHRVALTQIENAQREVSAEELAALSEAFHVSTDTLLDLHKDMEVFLKEETRSRTAGAVPMRVDVPQGRIDKFREILLYILNQVGSRPNVGETVIYKLLYFMDFDFYEKYEEQLIGATYMKNKFGPTPVEFSKIVQKMTANGEITSVKTSHLGFDQRKYLPNRAPDLSRLGAHEIKLIDEVLERLSHMGARQISEYSHGDIPWLTAENQKTIEYESVFYRSPQYSVRDYGPPEATI